MARNAAAKRAETPLPRAHCAVCRQPYASSNLSLVAGARNRCNRVKLWTIKMTPKGALFEKTQAGVCLTCWDAGAHERLLPDYSGIPRVK